MSQIVEFTKDAQRDLQRARSRLSNKEIKQLYELSKEKAEEDKGVPQTEKSEASNQSDKGLKDIETKDEALDYLEGIVEGAEKDKLVIQKENVVDSYCEIQGIPKPESKNTDVWDVQMREDAKDGKFDFLKDKISDD